MTGVIAYFLAKMINDKKDPKRRVNLEKADGDECVPTISMRAGPERWIRWQNFMIRNEPKPTWIFSKNWDRELLMLLR